MADRPNSADAFRYEDNPTLPEVFADSVAQWRSDGPTLGMEFLVKRRGEPREKASPSGRRTPVCRLARSADGAIELLDYSRQLTAALEQKGIIKTKAAEAKN